MDDEDLIIPDHYATIGRAVNKEFIAAAWPYKDAADPEHLMEGLHKAGLPE